MSVTLQPEVYSVCTQFLRESPVRSRKVFLAPVRCVFAPLIMENLLPNVASSVSDVWKRLSTGPSVTISSVTWSSSLILFPFYLLSTWSSWQGNLTVVSYFLYWGSWLTHCLCLLRCCLVMRGEQSTVGPVPCWVFAQNSCSGRQMEALNSSFWRMSLWWQALFSFMCNVSLSAPEGRV